MVQSLFNRLFLIVGAVLLSGCSDTPDTSAEVDAQQIEGVWVFTFREEPTFVMDALTGGTATIEDGCLMVGDQVVVWYDLHLPSVEEVIVDLEAGEAVVLGQLGGGGQSLDEGSTLEDFPAEVLEHCAPTAIWYAAPDDFTASDPT